jgi:hypothetical protein
VDKLELYKRDGTNWTSLAIANPSIADNTFYHYKVVLSGNNIKVFFNNETTSRINYTDTSSPYLSGKIGVRTDFTHAHFDNVNCHT